MFKGDKFRALGTMSGTSLDGVDAAEVITDGLTISGFGEVEYRPYTVEERKVLRAAFGKWQDDDVTEAAEIVETAHAQVMSLFDEAEVIGFHGQTVSHDPKGRGTHQIGDGRILAEFLQKPVVWDFRSADIELGGQGAPLAPFFHHALAKWIGASSPIGFLNLGGVGNLTWIDPAYEKPEEAGALLAFDTGPANAPLNDMVLERLGKAFDEEGVLAAEGTADEAIISKLLSHPYFFKMPPKSLDRNAFDSVLSATRDLSVEDAAATLTAAIALSVGEGLQHCPSPPSEILVSGGGRHNPTLMSMLEATLPCPVRPVEDYDLNGDMIEAQAFAYLAVRVAKGLPTSCPATTGVRASVCGGIISKPADWPS